LEFWLSWLESRTCGINQRVAGEYDPDSSGSPAEGAKPATKVVGFLFKVYFGQKIILIIYE
ncbi:hypothetical protein ACFE6N_23070, partial [Pedobacter sp. BG31]|uniref:hypothetical protein n=1 Tax=Pedobacter sp. BG31 TaxID=3349697 RepID=UPI0035F47484